MASRELRRNTKLELRETQPAPLASLREKRMTLERRIGALEAQSGADDDECVVWGPGNEHLPKMTKRELKKMLNDMHYSGSGRLLVRPATMNSVAADVTVIR